jgi:DNA processing protein
MIGTDAGFDIADARGVDARSVDASAERPYWIALSLVPGIGPVSFARLLARYGSARRAWGAGARMLADVPRAPAGATDVLRRLRRSGPTVITRGLERRLRLLGAQLLTPLDTGYPPALGSVPAPPPVLYLAGDADALHVPAVAVVGTRRPTGYGRSCATEIADELARAGLAVVSGLALGIDGEAHQAALAAHGRTIAVLPSPLDRIYPPRHRELAARIAVSGGALLTELPPGQAVGRPDFARRNRLIAGLSRATVVVEAPDRSGALLTASAAIDIGRELYAVPGPIDSRTSSGTNRLIADHLASLVTSPWALLTGLGVGRGERPVVAASLSEPEALALGTLLRRSGSIEELVTRTGVSAGALAGALTMLEARGLVTSYGGATFHPTLAARRIGKGG